MKKQAQDNEVLTRRKPAQLTIEVEDAAIAEHARRPRRSSTRARARLRPKPSSSAQVSPCFSLSLHPALQDSTGLALHACVKPDDL